MHVPVLLKETLEWLAIKKDGCYIDCTGGLGGHSQAILEKLGAGGKLIICDYHESSVKGLKEKFLNKKNVEVYHQRFSSIFDNLDLPFDGILADFGISSPQLENADLGIGFLLDDVALDMRIDNRLKSTAADLLKTLDEEELANVFYEYGGERKSRKIAAAIAYDRKEDKHYETTTELRQLCERVLGRFYKAKKIHPATKVFQALRIAVNQELDEVKIFLEKAPENLKKEGRLVTIAFHEGEDRLVKNRFRELAQTPDYQMPIRKAVKPSDEETDENPRARSARLRVLEKVT